jgi:hypothetical protein
VSQNNQTRSEEKMFRPSQTDLNNMVRAAEAKFEAARRATAQVPRVAVSLPGRGYVLVPAAWVRKVSP